MAIRHLATTAAAALLCAGSAFAAGTSVDGSVLIEGNSWTAGTFTSNFGGGGGDLIGLVVVAGNSTLESPVFSGALFAGAGWATSFFPSPTLAAASGPTVNSIGYNLTFSGSQFTSNWDIDFVLFNGGTQIVTTRLRWNGSAFSTLSNSINTSYDRSMFEPRVIPLPTGGALGLAGLGALAIRRRRAA